MRNEAVLMKLPPSHKLDFLRLEETLLSVMCCFLSIPDISLRRQGLTCSHSTLHGGAVFLLSVM